VSENRDRILGWLEFSVLITVFLLADFWRKPDYTLILKIHTKKFKKQEKLGLFVNRILQKGNIRVEIRAKTRVWEDSISCLETSNKLPFNNYISKQTTVLSFTLITWTYTSEGFKLCKSFCKKFENFFCFCF
jgi:hypothetical protein